jgi:alpha-ketoglutarate-dependent taurine dioxygenase
MSAHPFTVEPLDATFGAVVTGLKLTEINEAAFNALYRTWLAHGLLIFPGQYLDREQQIAFARRFGALEFDIAPISNVTPSGQIRSEAGDGLVRALTGRPRARSSPPMWSRPQAARPAGLTCAPPTTRSIRRRSS